MSSSKMTASDDKITTLVVLICCSTVVSVIGLILGAISLSQQGPNHYNIYTQSSGSISGGSAGAGNKKMWMIQLGHYDVNIAYLDPVTYQIKGYAVDVIDAVCDIAEKDCKIVHDIDQNCWDSVLGQSSRGGVGLMAKWYDACTGYIQTYDRLPTFAFTEPFHKQLELGIYAKKGTTLDPQTLTGYRIGFLDGWSNDEHCFARYATDPMYPIEGANLPVSGIVHFQSVPLLEKAVLDGQVDAAFLFIPSLPLSSTTLVKVTPDYFPNLCSAGGLSLMTQKSNKEFVRWWDDAFNRLVGTKRYDDICQNVLNEHADIAGDGPNDICIGY